MNTCARVSGKNHFGAFSLFFGTDLGGLVTCPAATLAFSSIQFFTDTRYDYHSPATID